MERFDENKQPREQKVWRSIATTLFRRANHAQAVEVVTAPIVETEEKPELSPRQQTLFIGGWFTTCGNCERNAHMDHSNHDVVMGEDVEGCGVEWTFVSSDECSQELIQPLRPDLQWRDPSDDDMDLTANTEARALIGYDVIGPVDPRSMNAEYN